MSRRRTTPRSKHKTSQEIAPVFYQLIIQVVIKQTKKLLVRRKKFVSRRAHKSFRLTRRRDYKRSLSMPGYWSFTNYVRSVLWKNKWLLTKFIAFYALFSGIILGIMSQQNYKLLSSTIQSVGGDALHGQLGNLGQGFVISAGILTSSFTGQLSQAQQVYGGLVFLLGWLSIIWLLRQVLAGHKKKPGCATDYIRLALRCYQLF